MVLGNRASQPSGNPCRDGTEASYEAAVGVTRSHRSSLQPGPFEPRPWWYWFSQKAAEYAHLLLPWTYDRVGVRS